VANRRSVSATANCQGSNTPQVSPPYYLGVKNTFLHAEKGVRDSLLAYDVSRSAPTPDLQTSPISSDGFGGLLAPGFGPAAAANHVLVGAPLALVRLRLRPALLGGRRGCWRALQSTLEQSAYAAVSVDAELSSAGALWSISRSPVSSFPAATAVAGSIDRTSASTRSHAGRGMFPHCLVVKGFGFDDFFFFFFWHFFLFFLSHQNRRLYLQQQQQQQQASSSLSTSAFPPLMSSAAASNQAVEDAVVARYVAAGASSLRSSADSVYGAKHLW
jgi:hypothetical protein